MDNKEFEKLNSKKINFKKVRDKIDRFITKDHFMNTPYQHLYYWKKYADIKYKSEEKEEKK